jgi:Bacterial inner membrane protein
MLIDAPLAQDLPAIVTGVAAALCLTASPMFRSRRMILLAQLAAGLCFASHYVCLGITVAAAVNLLGMVQTAAALFSARSAAMGRLGYALIVLMALVGLCFWQGPISALSVAATSLIALARMQSNEVRLRSLLLAGGAFWVMHDGLAGAWIAVTADIGAAVMGAAALFSILFRVTIEWRASLPAPTAPAARA